VLSAAQQTGRRGYVLKVAPEYMDVAIKRIQQDFPALPVIPAANGQPFAAVATLRSS
jgi:DNA modification methylase